MPEPSFSTVFVICDQMGSRYNERTELRKRPGEGFTLIELMVVVLIMGILMAIAVPTFLSTRTSANNSSAESNATNALTNEKAYFSSNGTFEISPPATVPVARRWN